jgi:hypothetical protein
MNNEFSQDDSSYVSILNCACTAIKNKWMMEKIGQIENYKVIKEKLLELIEEEYESQQLAKKSTVERVIYEKKDIHWLIEESLKLPFSSDNTYMAKFLHYNALFKACVNFDKKKINEEKINIMMRSIDEKLSNFEFMTQFKNENPDIIKSIKNIQEMKANTRIKYPTDVSTTIRRKPRYHVWGIVVGLFTGTSIGLYLYFKKN